MSVYTCWTNWELWSSRISVSWKTFSNHATLTLNTYYAAVSARNCWKTTTTCQIIWSFRRKATPYIVWWRNRGNCRNRAWPKFFVSPNSSRTTFISTPPSTWPAVTTETDCVTRKRLEKVGCTLVCSSTSITRKCPLTVGTLYATGWCNCSIFKLLDGIFGVKSRVLIFSLVASMLHGCRTVI